MRVRTVRQAGFTLIELMVVLILIGIFSGLMLSQMRGTYEDALLRSTSRKIISAANLASSKAVTLNQTHSLWLDTASGRLRIQTDREDPPIEEENLDSRIRIDLRDTIAEANEEADEPRVEQKQKAFERIDFFPDGTATGREIALRDRMGVELLLRINPVTGRIRILEGRVER